MTHKTFRVERRVYWGDTDMVTIMNMPRAFDFANAAIEDFYHAVVGIGFLDIICERGLGVPYVHASCDYTARLHGGERFTLDVAIERLGNSSITWEVVAAKLDGTQAFQVTLVSPVIQAESFTPIRIPDDFRAAMAPYVKAG